MKTRTVNNLLSEPVLNRLAHKYTSFGLVLAVVLHLTFVGAFWTSEYFSRSTDTGMIVTLPPINLGNQPKPIGEENIPNIVAAGPAVRPDKGIPVPVPEASVSIDKTIASQTDYDHEGTDKTEGGNGNGVDLSGTLKVPEAELPPPDTFRPVQRLPQIVKQVLPEYPELAQRVGLEGRVTVKLWVDKAGIPHQASVLTSDGEMFNQPAIDAAMQYRFTPAIMNNGPVSVWVTIPFVFKLRQSW